MLAAAGGAVIPAVALAEPQASEDRPIQLHADLAVDPAKEQEMLRIFRGKIPSRCRPTAWIYRYAHVETEVGIARRPSARNQLPIRPDLFQRGAAAEMDCDGDPQAALADPSKARLTDKNYSRLLYEVY